MEFLPRGIIGKGDATNFQVEVLCPTGTRASLLSPSVPRVCFPFLCLFFSRDFSTRVASRANKAQSASFTFIYSMRIRDLLSRTSAGSGSHFPRPSSHPSNSAVILPQSHPCNPGVAVNCARQTAGAIEFTRHSN